ncbi:nitroreductase family protein [Olivibacter sitiensis]|uniref:nitroreductase family protein n=1 Tax=Olivibacter sitiensis TaxID=376470 RepID=UPI0003FDF456|nr:nitroreductase family protein [Olivibacter sitiensis]
MKQRIVSFFLNLLAQWLWKLRNYFSAKQSHYISWGTASPFRSTLYYLLFSAEFDNIHFRLLNGKSHFLDDPKSLGVYSKTRRNIHRLEKGIAANMLDRRNSFATDYISETIDDFSALAQNGANPYFLKWGKDVLETYFSIVTQTDSIEALYTKFRSIDLSKSDNHSIKSIPYAYGTVRSSKPTFEQLNSLLVNRHSVRWYNGKRVADDIIQKAVSAALTAPSACNRQAFKVYCLQGDKLEDIKRLKLGFEIFADYIHTFLFIVGDLSAYVEERDKHLIYIDGGLFAMSLMLALETMGVSSCPINYPDMSWLDNEIERILDLQRYQKGVMLISIGYANEDSPIPFSAKKQVNEVLTFVK